jgi:hypothetical protein
MSSDTLIDVKQAIASAMAFVKKVYGKVDGLRLEEVELSDYERYWLITIGFDEPATKSPLKQILSSHLPVDEMIRVYKIIKIDAKTGEALSMKIRTV